MNARLIQTCGGMWLVGLLGMAVLRMVLDTGPGELSFDLFSRFWLVGGLGYAVLGAFQLTGTAEEAPADERAAVAVLQSGVSR